MDLDSRSVAIPQLWGDKVKGLKEMYALCMLQISKVVAYKKAIGVEPDSSLLKQILWVCMHVGSKNLVSQLDLGRKEYFDIFEDTDRRYRLQFDSLVFAKTAKGDDPRIATNTKFAFAIRAYGISDNPPLLPPMVPGCA